MMDLAEMVQEQYLKRIRDEFENKKVHKRLIEERKVFVEQVFDDYEEKYFK